MARILIVEDQAHVLHVLRICIARGGHEIETANSGRSGLAQLQALPFDLLITDLEMPDGDGLTLAQYALQPPHKLRRVFIVTGAWDTETVLQYLPDPRVRVLQKPFRPSQLLREVQFTVFDEQRPELPHHAPRCHTGGGEAQT